VSGKEHRKAFITTYNFNIQTNLKGKMWNLHKMQNWILSELHEPMPWCEWLQIGGMQLIQHSEQDLFSGMPICCPRFIRFFFVAIFFLFCFMCIRSLTYNIVIRRRGDVQEMSKGHPLRFNKS
jgi:hypothetical protein